MPEALVALAGRQGGLVMAAQAEEIFGRTPMRRMIESGQWRRVTRGVYGLSPESPTDEQRLWAGVLLSGPGSAIGGHAALSLVELSPVPDVVEVWTPDDSIRRGPPGFVFRRDHAARLDHVVGSLSRIRTEEALIDVGQCLDVEGWVAILADAVRVGAVSLPSVIKRIDARTRLTQRAMLKAVTLDLSGIESTLEWIYRARVERAHRLPTGVRQVSVVDGWRCDVRYDPWSLIAELDGRVHLKRVFRDLDRDNQHVLRGSATLRYGSVDLRGRPCAVADQVAAALRQRGWAGEPARCPRCPPVV